MLYDGSKPCRIRDFGETDWICPVARIDNLPKVTQISNVLHNKDTGVQR